MTVETYEELGGVSVYFVDGEDRCLESRFWDLVKEDREGGPWFLLERTFRSFKGLEPVIVIKDKYGRDGRVFREQTDLPNGIEVTLQFRARLDDGRRVEARDRQDFTRELAPLPTPADAEVRGRREVGSEVRRQAAYRSALLAGAQERGWPAARQRVLRRWLLGGALQADLRWLMSQLGPQLRTLVTEVVDKLGPEAPPKKIAALVSGMDSFGEELRKGPRA